MEREGWGELGERERDAVRELEREGFWKREWKWREGLRGGDRNGERKG